MPDPCAEEIAGGSSEGGGGEDLEAGLTHQNAIPLADAGPALGKTSVRRYFAGPELVKLVRSATTDSGETETFKWMTGQQPVPR